MYQYSNVGMKEGNVMGVLAGKTALVTGASRGIGRSIALAFAQEGADVAVNYRRAAAEANEVGSLIEGLERRAHLVQADVSKENDVRVMVDEVMNVFGHIDILVNNAGFVTLAPVESMDIELWDEMIATHLRGTFLVTRMVLPDMLERGDGRIINVSSQIGQIGREWFAHYAAAKAGIIGFTKSLARESAPRGVLVNCIAPGPIDTGIVPKTDGAPEKNYISLLPSRRVGEPDEVAPTAVFLASDASTYYVGQTLGPNGGDVML
jgi:3-oxoacyl-[acyl-carrier protein] reductase